MHRLVTLSAIGLMYACSSPSAETIPTEIKTEASTGWKAEPYSEFLADLGLQEETAKLAIHADDAPMVVRLQQWVDKIDELIRNKGPKTKFEKVPKPKIRLIEDPQRNAFVKRVEAATPEVGSDLIVYSALVEKLKESEIVFLLAHELQHYYRGHIKGAGKDYLYHLSEEKNPKAPLTSPDLAEMNAKLTQALENGRKAAAYQRSLEEEIEPGLYPRIPGQKINTYMAGLTLKWVDWYDRSFCAAHNRASFESNCGWCSNAASFIKANKELEKVLDNSRGFIGPLTLDPAVYLSFETAALQCLNTVKLENDLEHPTETPTLDSLSEAELTWWLNTLAFGLPATSLPKFEGYLGEFMVTQSKDMASETTFVLDEAKFSKFAAHLPSIEKQADIVSASNLVLDELANEASDKQIGLYSREHLTDELALNVLEELKIDPKFALTALMSLQADEERRSACLEISEQSWKDVGGNEVILPWGWIAAGEHPDVCSRVRNIDKEIVARAYPKPTLDPTAELKPSWDDLIKDHLIRSAQISSPMSLDQKARLQAELLRVQKGSSCEFVAASGPKT